MPIMFFFSSSRRWLPESTLLPIVNISYTSPWFRFLGAGGCQFSGTSALIYIHLLCWMVHCNLFKVAYCINFGSFYACFPVRCAIYEYKLILFPNDNCCLAGEWMNKSAGLAFTPHIINIAIGEVCYIPPINWSALHIVFCRVFFTSVVSFHWS